MKGMNHILTIFKRELAAYFNNATAYIFIIVFVLLNGGLFMTQFFVIGRADMRTFFITLPYLLAVFLPAVTMRQWAEERRGNTLELLLTFPMGTHELVIGKFAAALLFYLSALAGTLTLPVMIQALGNPDMGAIFSGYVGAAFLGCFYLAIGIFISGLCRDQIVAFILSMMICFGLHLIGTEFLAASIDGWLPGFGTLLRRFLGSAPHYEAFAKGVMDNRDVLYFVIGTGLFLTLNGFWLEGRMRPKATRVFAGATALCAGIFLMSNWLLAGIPLGRFDMTEGGIYTIAPATKKILRDLKAPVTAKYYVSSADKMPTGMKTVEQDVVDKLDELRVASGGKFQYKIFHMEAANIAGGAQADQEDSLEKQIQSKGIQPFQVQAIESDEVQVRLVYSSLSLSYKEKPEELIPRIVPSSLYELEYLVVSKIYRMTLTEDPKIAVVAPYQEKEVDPAMKELLRQLGGQVPDAYREDNYEILEQALAYEGYDTARIKLTEDDPLPQGTDTLVVVEPQSLNDRQRYEIGRFLAAGGSLFLAVQNYTYEYAPRGNQLQLFPEKKNPQVNSLLKGWGFEVDERILVDQQHDVINLSGAARLGPFELSIPVKIPIQILLKQSNMNPDISVTSRLSSMFYLWGTALKMDDAEISSQNLKVTPLLKSSRDSWTVPFVEGALRPEQLTLQAGSEKGPLPLAVLAEGQFKDVYAAAEVPAWPAAEGDEAAAAPPPVESPVSIEPAPGKMILIGAASLFQKHLITGGGNLNFFMNSIDALTLGDELVTIRSKQPIDRSIGRVSAAVKVGWRFFVTLFIPLAIAVVGTLRVLWRRKSKQSYLKSLASVKS